MQRDRGEGQRRFQLAGDWQPGLHGTEDAHQWLRIQVLVENFVPTEQVAISDWCRSATRRTDGRRWRRLRIWHAMATSSACEAKPFGVGQITPMGSRYPCAYRSWRRHLWRRFRRTKILELGAFIHLAMGQAAQATFSGTFRIDHGQDEQDCILELRHQSGGCQSWASTSSLRKPFKVIEWHAKGKPSLRDGSRHCRVSSFARGSDAKISCQGEPLRSRLTSARPREQ